MNNSICLKSILLLLNLFVFFTFNLLLYSSDNKEFNELVGSEGEEKEIFIVYLLPEESCEKKLTSSSILNYYKLRGYEVTPKYLNKENKKTKADEKGSFEELKNLFSNKNILSSDGFEVFAFFTHGNHSSGDKGFFSVEFYADEDERNTRLTLLQNVNFNKNQFYGSPTPSAGIKELNEKYIYALNVEASFFNDYAAGDFINNGIAFLMCCRSHTFADTFKGKGASTVYGFDRVSTCTQDVETFNALSQELLGIGESSEFKSTKEARDFQNTHYVGIAQGKDSSDKNEKGNDPLLKLTGNENLYLLRNPHIDELIIRNKKGDKEFYHYKYEDKDNKTPTKPYPYSGYSTNTELSYTDAVAKNIILEDIPIDKELEMEIHFSSPTYAKGDKGGQDVTLPEVTIGTNKARSKVSNNQTGGSSIPKKGQDIEIKGNLSDQNKTWKGAFEITKEYITINNISTNSNNKIYIHISTSGNYDTDNKIISYAWNYEYHARLDKTGDGLWKKAEDGEYDNNHWFQVESAPSYSAQQAEILDQHLATVVHGKPIKVINPQPNITTGEYEMNKAKDSPIYYLGKDGIKNAVAARRDNIGTMDDLYEKGKLKTGYYPGLTVILATQAVAKESGQHACTPLDIAGEKTDDYRKGMKLTLEVAPFEKGGKVNTFNAVNSTTYDLEVNGVGGEWGRVLYFELFYIH